MRRHTAAAELKWFGSVSAKHLRRGRISENVGLDVITIFRLSSTPNRKFGMAFAPQTSGDNKLSFTEFTLACRNIGYMGSVKTLFKELDPGTGVIMLEDLDPETHDRPPKPTRKWNNISPFSPFETLGDII